MTSSFPDGAARSGSGSVAPKTALVTGASSGTGLAIARLFAADGHNLILVARSGEVLQGIADELAATHAIHVHVIAKDFFVPGAAQQVYDEVRQCGITVDYLVNDAGQTVYGRFVETDLARELDIVHLNVHALVVLTKLFLRDMVARGEGRVLQLASMVSTVPAPLQAVYAGTKAFIHNFTESVIAELADSPVALTLLRPGATDTDIFRKAGADVSKLYQAGPLDPPEDVARDGYEAMMAGKDAVISGVKTKLQVAAARLVPDRVLARQVLALSMPVAGEPLADGGTEAGRR